jgi:CheY-like chemotaxis protein/predicted Ser/Thr protein kinase
VGVVAGAEGARARGRRSRAETRAAAERRFESRYELLGEVGRGAMGAVFKAYDRELEEVIALKSLVEAVRTDPRRIARFKNEIKLARKLSHPNIARVHDLVEVHGRLCLSMAFIEGRSLDAIVRDEGRLEPARVLRHLAQLAPALDLAHASGIVHRDIKPANIIVDADDAPHIVDFGIAASASDGATARVGTPSFMAPECWRVGEPGVVVDARCDLYALGVTLYEMVCGHVPFWNRDLAVLMAMHCERPPRRPQAIVPGVPDVLDAVILRLMEKDPAARFQRAGEILEALDARRSAGARPVQARPAGAVPPVARLPGVRGKILLADGDRQAARPAVERIRQHDFIVIEAGDGVQAVEKAFQELPDLVVLDSDLKVLDVLDVIRLLRKDDRTRNVPLVVLSGVDDPDYEALVRDVGAAAYFVKPVPPAVLDLLIGRYFG